MAISHTRKSGLEKVRIVAENRGNPLVLEHFIKKALDTGIPSAEVFKAAGYGVFGVDFAKEMAAMKSRH